MGKGITRRRYGSGHPRSGSRTRAFHPPRWTLRENPSSQPGRDLARKYKTAQNFRNWWLRISGTHKNTVRPAFMRHDIPPSGGFFGILAFKSRQAKIGWKSFSQNQLPPSNQALTGQQ